MTIPCGRIAGLVSEALGVEKCYGVSAGRVLLQLLGLAAGLVGKQIRFARHGKVHPLKLSMIVSTPDATMPSWMRVPWDVVLSQQASMEQAEASLKRSRIPPESHRELRRNLALVRNLGVGFEARALLLEQELAKSKLTVNIDLIHEVARLGGRRVSKRPPVGDSLLVLANGSQEIGTLKKAALKEGGLWNQLGCSDSGAVSFQAWCPPGQLMSALSPDPYASASRIGYILHHPEERAVEGYFPGPRSASRDFLLQLKNRRISGGYTLVDPFPQLADALEGACDNYLAGIPDGLACQARHLGTTHDLSWHIASLLIPMMDSNEITDDDSYIDLVTLVSMLARELLVGHLTFLSGIRPVGPEGVLSGLHRSFIAHCAKEPATLRVLQRGQRYVSKNTCQEVLAELAQLGLVETTDGKIYRSPAPVESGLSEFLSDFVAKHRYGRASSAEIHCKH